MGAHEVFIHKNGAVSVSGSPELIRPGAGQNLNPLKKFFRDNQESNPTFGIRVEEGVGRERVSQVVKLAGEFGQVTVIAD